MRGGFGAFLLGTGGDSGMLYDGMWKRDVVLIGVVGVVGSSTIYLDADMM